MKLFLSFTILVAYYGSFGILFLSSVSSIEIENTLPLFALVHLVVMLSLFKISNLKEIEPNDWLLLVMKVSQWIIIPCTFILIIYWWHYLPMFISLKIVFLATRLYWGLPSGFLSKKKKGSE